MHRIFFRFVGPALLLLSAPYSAVPLLAQSSSAQSSGARGEIFERDFSEGVDTFPGIFRPYQSQPIAPPRLDNSRRLSDLIKDRTLTLSLGDALALALENNLDIEIQRYIVPSARTDVLRARSGQAARGFQGALVPGGLNVGAIGAGVSAAGGGAGVGGAGGITGGGGAVQVGPTGTFDPSLTVNFSQDHTESPLNTQVVAGVPAVTTDSTALTSSYAQLFPTGTSYFASLTTIRQKSNQQFLLFNPAVISRFSVGGNQPLLRGFGLLPNERFILVARNNQRVSEDLFRLQLTNVIVGVENLYWDMASLQENVRLAEQSLEVALKLYQDNQARAEAGTLARLDVLAAQSEVANRRRDLIVARTNLEIQGTRLKNALSRRTTTDLDAARIVTTDPLPAVRAGGIPDLEKALETTLARRPDLSQALNNERNQDIATRFTRNGLLPDLSAFGLWAGAGLAGNTTSGSRAGLGESFEQAFTGDFPEYAGGLTFNLPIRNRAAQADDLRAQLESNQLQITTQRLRNQIVLELRQALIQLQQGQAQMDAAQEALTLARATRDAEMTRQQAGLSTPYEEVLRQRDVVASGLAALQARTTYAKALVELDRATGTTLERRGVVFRDALTGEVSSLPHLSDGTPQPDERR